MAICNSIIQIYPLPKLGLFAPSFFMCWVQRITISILEAEKNILHQEMRIFSTMNCSPNKEGQVGKSSQGCHHDYENSGTQERLKWKHFSCPLGISHLDTNPAQLQSISLQSSKQGVDEVNSVGML